MTSTKQSPCPSCRSTSILVSLESGSVSCRNCGASLELATPSSLEATFGEVIHSYTRAQAIEDGVLVDLSAWGGSAGMLAGWSCPVAVTSALWSSIEDIPEKARGTQDVRGRAHDVLFMARVAAQRTPDGDSVAPFRVILPTASSRKRTIELVAHAGPGDAGELVVTIGFSEDF